MRNNNKICLNAIFRNDNGRIITSPNPSWLVSGSNVLTGAYADPSNLYYVVITSVATGTASVYCYQQGDNGNYVTARWDFTINS
jgi:hypothetical protein